MRVSRARPAPPSGDRSKAVMMTVIVSLLISRSRYTHRDPTHFGNSSLPPKSPCASYGRGRRRSRPLLSRRESSHRLTLAPSGVDGLRYGRSTRLAVAGRGLRLLLPRRGGAQAPDRASRTATRPPRSSCWGVVVDMDCDEQGPAAAATTTDIKRVGLVRARDLASERHAGYDLIHQLAGGEPPEIRWP
jgi:hypothetical protein